MENTTSTTREEQEKFTLIDSLITAMVSPKEYDKLLKLSTGKIVRYIAVLLLLVCFIQYAIPTLGAIAGLGGMRSIIMNEIPEFSLENGEFYYEEQYEKKDEVSGVFVQIDTNVDEFTRDDIPQNMYQAILVSKNNVLISNAMYGFGMVEEQRFDILEGITINNETVADMSGFIYVVLAGVFVVQYLFSIFQFLCSAVIYAAVMFLLARNIADINFGTVFKVTIFAQTIGVIVEAVGYCVGTELFIMAGSIFNVFASVILMNRVIMQFRKSDIL